MHDRITLQTGAAPNKDEILTANFLISQNKKTTIRFLAASNVKGTKTPDIEMDGVKWEIKCPRGAGKYLMQNIIHKAIHQAPNIIIDLRRAKMHQAKALNEIEKVFNLSKSAKTIIIITKSKKILEYKK
jgi:hypothetical protein